MEKTYKDIESICIECGKEFIWTEGEQSFMNQLLENKKIKNIVQPKRCKDCRMKRKEKYNK